MSMGIGHFAFGATGTVVLVQMLPLKIRIKMRIAQAFIILLGGAWALFPDIAKHTQRLEYINANYWTKTGLPSLNRFIDILPAFHDSRWANLSFFHQFLDFVDASDSIVVSSILVVLMLVTVSVSLIREMLTKQPQKTR